MDFCFDRISHYIFFTDEIRIRLYAGGDRPFFEDVEAAQPTIYIIHNLLSTKECDALIEQAKTLVRPVVQNDSLQLTQDYKKFVDIEQGYDLGWNSKKSREEKY